MLKWLALHTLSVRTWQSNKYCGGKHPGFRCWKEHSSRFDNKVRNPSLSQVHKGCFQMSPNPLESQPLPTPVRLEILNDFLEGYPQEQRNYLIDGFKNGFQLNFSGERLAQDSPNLKSANDNPEVVQAKIDA